jgi:hypothetical protein
MKVVRLTTLVVSPRIQQGDQLMSKHVTISPAEAADRLAMRELVEAYARCADRRDVKGQMSLLIEDTHFVFYMNAKDPKPSQELRSRDALASVFADLNKYEATTHMSTRRAHSCLRSVSSTSTGSISAMSQRTNRMATLID